MEKWFTQTYVESENLLDEIETIPHHSIKDLVDYYESNSHRVILTMGKGGVGKTTVASLVALGLAEKGKKVHLTTTIQPLILLGLLMLTPYMTI